VGVKKLHKLLYYCQGHHLATFDEPLFRETISAWDMGPVVGTLWRTERNDEPAPVPVELTEAQLNSIGYVLSRYGKLTGQDLENLTHSESPWLRADENRPHGGRARIEPLWIKEYFQTRGSPGDDDEIQFDPDEVAGFLSAADPRPPEPGQRDTLEEIQARLT
jgi:uncharacterized phage-associated protein